MNETVSKKQYPSSQQKSLLVRLIEADPQLKCGKFSANFTKKDAENRWKIIAEELNSITGAKKTWEAWRKAWQDKKCKTKNKFSRIRQQHRNLSEKGPPPEPLTQENEVVLSTISESALIEHKDRNESIVEFIDVKKEMPCSSSQDCIVYESLSVSVLLELDDNIDEVQSARNSHHCDGSLAYPPSRVKPQRAEGKAESMDTTAQFSELLKEKNKIKERFYENFIKLMERQTEALESIAKSLNKQPGPD